MTTPPNAADPLAWPLVGREDEVSLASDALDRRGALVLAGVSGVGKTRLAREVVARVADGGARTHWVAATRAASSVTLGAFAHLVPPTDVASPAPGQDARAATLDAVVRALRHHAGAGTVVVGVDDAHLLDDASATLLHLLASEPSTRVVATVRTGEPTPDPVVALWKDELALRVELQPLARIEVAELLGRTLGGTVDGATARRLFEVTRGNVLFLRELVSGGLASDALVERSGVWCWDGALRPGVRLRDLVAERLGTLDDAERDALELVALGEPVPDAVLTALVADEVLQRLERRHLLESHATGGRIEVGLGHPLFGEVLLDDASPRRLRACRRQLADAWMGESSGGPDDLLRVATWRTEAGQDIDADTLLAGARRAIVLGDAATGERLARTAHETAPSVEAAVLLADALHSHGRMEEAVDVLHGAEDLPGSEVAHAELATSIADALVAGLDRPLDALAVWDDAAARLDDPVALDTLESQRSLYLSLGAPTTSEALSYVAGRLEGPHVSPLSELRAQLGCAAAWADAGELERAIDTTTRAVGVALEIEHPGLALYHSMVLAQSLTMAGRLDQVRELVDGAYEVALSAHSFVARGAWCMLRGVLEVFRGRPDRARAALYESDLVLGQFDYGLRRGGLIWLAFAEAMQGDAVEAEKRLDEAQRVNRSRARLYDADWARARAWTLVAAGRQRDGARAAAEAAEVAARAERWPYEVLGLHDQARFGFGPATPATVVDRLDELAARVDGELAPACAAHARALAAGDGPGLDAAATRFDELGLGLFAAEAQAAAAAAHQRQGNRAAAHAAAARATRLAEACAGATTPLLRTLAALDRPTDLTPREREIAELAARGLADREIADALVVSVRTVHAHLRSVYAKLGVGGRGDLAQVLDLPPPRR